jgi:predicted aldo/keto reductase-like oxidoreductase
VEYVKLGRTGLDTSVIGIGTEHLKGQSRRVVVSVIHEAIERGVNYFDLIWALPEYLASMGTAFREHRDQVLLTAHLGSTERNGQYSKSRSVKRCLESFHGVLSSLGTDHVDVLFLHNCNSLKDWNTIIKPSGIADLAIRLREQGKTRFIGFSGHFASVQLLAVESGLVDVAMFPVNLFGHAMPQRQEFLELCARRDIGLVAMKPFAGGKLLREKGTVRVPKMQTSGLTYKTRIPPGITPVQCLSYVLAQIGVSVALPGVKNADELAATLAVLDASQVERDFSNLLAEFGRYEDGECVYCNHCLPCPAMIDIGQVNRMVDLAQWGLSHNLLEAYMALSSRPSACTQCGACDQRCPFGVEAMATVQQAASVFERSDYHPSR